MFLAGHKMRAIDDRQDAGRRDHALGAQQQQRLGGLARRHRRTEIENDNNKKDISANTRLNMCDVIMEKFLFFFKWME